MKNTDEIIAFIGKKHRGFQQALLYKNGIGIKFRNSDLNDIYSLFHMAALLGKKEIMQDIYELLSAPQQEEWLNKRGSIIFKMAAECGQVDVIEWLYKVTPPSKRNELIHIDNDGPFIVAVQYGQIDVMEWLLKHTPNPDKREAMIERGREYGFSEALIKGHLAVACKMLDLTKNAKLSKMIHHFDDYSFIQSAHEKQPQSMEIIAAVVLNLGEGPEKIREMCQKASEYCSERKISINDPQCVKYINEPESLIKAARAISALTNQGQYPYELLNEIKPAVEKEVLASKSVSKISPDNFDKSKSRNDSPQKGRSM